MAITPVLTMLDIAAIEQKPLVKAIQMAMFEGQLPTPMEMLPVASAQSLTQQTIRMTDGGAPTTRNLGDAVVGYKATFADRHETLKIIENAVKLDKIYLDIKTLVQDPLALQFKAYGAVVKSKVNDLFINGDPTAVVSDPAGLRFRLQNDATFLNQAVNAAGLDLHTVATLEANSHTWLDFIDEAITLCGGGDPDLAIINRQTWIRFRSALRRLKILDTTRDQFDREIMTYGRVKFVNAGQKASGVLTSAAAQQVIGNDTETSLFGTVNTTPMYFVQTRSEEGVRLLQLHPMRMVKVGLDTGDPGQYVIDFTWPIGFATPQKFCISTVQGLDIT